MNARKIAVSIYTRMQYLTKYLWAKYVLQTKPLDIELLSNVDTLRLVHKKHCSVIRFGDGELMYINGYEPPFQCQDSSLVAKLRSCLLEENEKVLVCLPEPIVSRKGLRTISKWYWTYICAKQDKLLRDLIQENRVYGNAFISRPYLVYKDKKQSNMCFDLLKALWYQRNVLLIEGEYSRNGVGNDLFADAISVRRIIAPAKNAYDVYDQIIEAVLATIKNKEEWIVLISLGPTAKPLTVELANNGLWAIDIGHIDSEYEWYLRKASDRVQIPGKHTAEMSDGEMEACRDNEYLTSIVCRIGGDKT